MANWAYTNYVIEGPQEILDKINDAILHPVKSEEASNHWEGDVLNTLGIEWEMRKKLDDGGHYMRGFIADGPWMNNGALSFNAEEAWEITDFYKVLQEHFPEIKIYWNCEEQDNGIFETNDKEGEYFTDRYYVDACIDGNYESDYFSTKEEAMNYIQNISDCETEADIEAFNDNRRDADSDDFINLYEFKVVEDEKDTEGNN